MRRISTAMAGTTICAVFVLTMLSPALSADAPKITKEELRTWIEKGDVMVVDVRSGRDWTLSEHKIHTAVRENPAAVESWAKKYAKDKTLVLNCA